MSAPSEEEIIKQLDPTGLASGEVYAGTGNIMDHLGLGDRHRHATHGHEGADAR